MNKTPLPGDSTSTWDSAPSGGRSATTRGIPTPFCIWSWADAKKRRDSLSLLFLCQISGHAYFPGSSLPHLGQKEYALSVFAPQ